MLVSVNRSKFQLAWHLSKYFCFKVVDRSNPIHIPLNLNCIEGIVYRLVPNNEDLSIPPPCLVWGAGAVSLPALAFAVKPHVRGRDECRDSRICHHGSHTPCSRLAYCIMTKDQLLLIFGSPAPWDVQTAIFAAGCSLCYKKARLNNVKLV